MLRVDYDHDENRQSHGHCVEQRMAQGFAQDSFYGDQVTGQSTQEAHHISADDISRLCGDLLRHGEDNESGGPERSNDYGVFLEIQGQEYEENHQRSKQALEDIILPILTKLMQASRILHVDDSMGFQFKKQGFGR